MNVKGQSASVATLKWRIMSSENRDTRQRDLVQKLKESVARLEGTVEDLRSERDALTQQHLGASASLSTFVHHNHNSDAVIANLRERLTKTSAALTTSVTTARRLRSELAETTEDMSEVIDDLESH